MNNNLLMRVQHYSALKSKYKITQYEDSSPSSLLYLILRKVDLEIDLTTFEYNWLLDRQLLETFELIESIEQERHYRAEEPQRLEAELLQLKSKYNANSCEVQLSSLLYPILWKLDSENLLTDSELKWLEDKGLTETIAIVHEMEQFIALKAKYRATQYKDSFPSSPLYQILKLLDAEERLSDAEVNWLKEQELFATLTAFQQQEEKRQKEANFAQLKDKYQATKHQDSSTLSPLYPILLKLNVEKPLSDSEFDWLIQHELAETIAIAQEQEAKRDFADLKEKYQATQYKDSSLSSPLYAILRRLEEGELLNSVETNWLQEQGLTETLAIASVRNQFYALKEKYQATNHQDFLPSSFLYEILRHLESGNILNSSEVNWLQQNGLFQTTAIAEDVRKFSALKFKYQLTKYNDCSPSVPLYQILQKIDSGIKLSEVDINWLQQQDMSEIISLAEELEVRRHFAQLKLKYKIIDPKNELSIEPFYGIMQKLEREERLDPVLVVKLIEEGLLSRDGMIAIAYNRLEALFYEKEFERTKEIWRLPTASSHWRKAKEPQRAIELTNKVNLSNISDNALKSRLLVTRGAAFRDIGQLDNAENCAMLAIESQNYTHQPYTLMGAICYDRYEYLQGDDWFEKAIERGAEREDMDDELRRVVRNALGNQRRVVVEYLLNKDPVRYSWAKHLK